MSHPHDPTKLRPLTPGYDPEQHGIYLAALEDALADSVANRIHNIALTGGYGTGKSSILQELIANPPAKTIQISLSTLGTEQSEAADSSTDSPTNRIQKEIVKQLLYQQLPSATPGSRYRRLSRLPVARTSFLALLAGLAVALLVHLTGTTGRLTALTEPLHPPARAVLGAVWLASAAAVFVLLLLAHNRIVLKQFTAGSTTIALSSPADTYFDEYLDEIVYSFETSRAGIVVFEDIDRFNNPYIFETLRSLNTLLNAAAQLHRRPVRFVYAIKDSIFDELEQYESARDTGASVDHARSHLARANRTKFFDTVISVVPFITHLNARDLMIRTMDGVGPALPDAVFDLAARHVADMRLIIETRNEYLLFSRVVLGAGSEGLQLRPESLFGMMLYKSTHLTDFEAIRTGQSRLDQLLTQRTACIAQNLAAVAARTAEIHHTRTSDATAAALSRELGHRLAAYLARTAARLGVPGSYWQMPKTYHANGSTYTASQIDEPAFWRAHAAAPGDIQVTLQHPYYNSPHDITVTPAEVGDYVGQQLPDPVWTETRDEQLRDELTRLDARRAELARMSLQTLIERPDITMTYQGRQLTFQQVTAALIESDLARDLIAAGYIDSNFTLYTSKYYDDRVSAAASNFILHVIDPGNIDLYAPLAGGDVDAILRERGTTVLTEPSMYNLAVLDHLLATDSPHVRLLLRPLADPGEPELDLVRAGLIDGGQQTAFAAALAAIWTGTFRFLAEALPLSEDQLAPLMDAALTAADADLRYDTGGTLRRFIENHYRQLPAITAATGSPDRTAAVLRQARVVLDDLADVSDDLTPYLIAADAYRITRPNLAIAAAPAGSLALDVLRRDLPPVYRYVTNHLDRYAAALTGADVSITGSPVPVLMEVGDHAGPALDAVIARIATGKQVPRLPTVPSACWPSLAADDRFPPTFSNINAYLVEIGGIDAALADLLTRHPQITVTDDDPQPARTALALQIVAAPGALPDPALRTRLVTSLHLDEPLPPGELHPDDSPIVGLLLAAGQLPDSPDTLALTRGSSWPTREAALAASAAAHEFLDPADMPAADLERVLTSERIPKATKTAAVKVAASAYRSTDRGALQALARYCLRHDWRLSTPTLTKLAAAGVDTDTVLQLLGRLPAEAALELIAPVLTALGDPWAKLAGRTGKRPKIPDTPATDALLTRLQDLDLIAGTHPADGTVTVVLRQPERG